MQVENTHLPGVVIIIPRVFPDPRGFFLESYNQASFQQHGLDAVFLQDNHSKSARGTLRGLHFQLPPMAQVKLVRVDTRRRLGCRGRHPGRIAHVRPVGRR